MINLTLIPKSEFDRVRDTTLQLHDELSIIADMCRANALASVKRAGSGHLGSSFSAMDLVTWLYHHEMNTLDVGFDNPNRDVYFSSKGHDVPGLYAVLYSLGVVSREKFLKLRRFGGLDGHPDVGTRGIEANSGSLGMGISKGRGIAWAKKKLNHGGRVFVMLGDGELQEGQNYEALQSTVSQGITNITLLIDHNKVQSDKLVQQIVDLGNLENKLRAFGWHVAQCDGNDVGSIEKIFKDFASINDKPKAIIAHTIKGRGISFMEHPAALKNNNGYYKWHAGAPDDESYTAGYKELIDRVNTQLRSFNIPQLKLEEMESEVAPSAAVPLNALGEPISVGADVKKASVTTEYVAEAYGDALVELAASHPELVVLDADLAADCRVRKFELAYPDRFIENGIAEQDMVSMAGGLARHGLLPVVNSFASFLASRANEQIYNNAGERTKIIYACHYAGVIPAGPGKSHQSLRDISLFGALPNCLIIQPSNAVETKIAVRYCVETAKENCMIRMNISPSPRIIQLPNNYTFALGKGVTLNEGNDAILFAYGPVLLNEALLAAELLNEKNFKLQVVNMPWLNRFDTEWLRDITKHHAYIYTLDDHAPVGGLGDGLLNALVSNNLLGNRLFQKFAVEGYPACGTPIEALQYHALDGDSLAKRIKKQA